MPQACSAGFNPRAPYGARPRTRVLCAEIIKFQSTRPVRGATYTALAEDANGDVSIHAPRTGRDVHSTTDMELLGGFNPRAPYGARPRMSARSHGISSFNPRAPYGARPMRAAPTLQSRCFNPRAPYGARPESWYTVHEFPPFQSTRPVRGATMRRYPHSSRSAVSIHAPRTGRDSICSCQRMTEGVSIHAPRVGRDPQARRLPLDSSCFNPRAPCGARHAEDFDVLPPVEVSIHAPRAGRDEFPDTTSTYAKVSIHAPRAGRDGDVAHDRNGVGRFNPRAPCGARL